MEFSKPSGRKHPAIFKILNQHHEQQQAPQNGFVFPVEFVISIDNCLDQ